MRASETDEKKITGGSCGLNFSAERSSRNDRYNSYFNFKQAKILGAKCVPVRPQIRQAHHDALLSEKENRISPQNLNKIR